MGRPRRLGGEQQAELESAWLGRPPCNSFSFDYIKTCLKRNSQILRGSPVSDCEDGPDGDSPLQLHLHPAPAGVLHQARRHVQGPPLLSDHAPGLN